MKIRYKVYLLMILYIIGTVTISLFLFQAIQNNNDIQSTITDGLKLQIDTREIKSLMKDMVFELFEPNVYSQLRSLTYSPRPTKTFEEWENAIQVYQASFDSFMGNVNIIFASDVELQEQYQTAHVINKKALDLLDSLRALVLEIEEKHRGNINIYNAMQKDESLTPFFYRFQETSYYFANSFESFMNYFITSLEEEGEVLTSQAIQKFIVIFVVFLAVAISFTANLTADVAKKMIKLENAFRNVSYGNLSSISDIKSQDEFGELSQSLSALVWSLKKNVDSILNLTKDVGSFISESANMQQLLELIVTAVLEDTDTEIAQFYTYDQDQELDLKITSGLVMEKSDQEHLINYLAVQVFHLDNYILYKSNHNRMYDNELGIIQSVLAIPIPIDSKIFGLLVAIKTIPGSYFSDLNIIQLVSFAEYVSMTIDHFNKYKELLERREAQYQALQSQLQPHFIYNVLSSILGLGRKGDTERLGKTIEALKVMLRYIQSNEKWTTLGEEVNFIKKYCQLQQIRFGDRIEFTYDIDEKVLHLQVPRLLIQPIVENAIIHGLESLEEGGVLSLQVHSQKRNDELTADIIVQDNGIGFEQNKLNKKSSIGITNVKQRLQLLFPYGRFIIESGEGKGTKVEIRL